MFGDAAFRLDPVQEELLQAALRRDGGAAARWRAIITHHASDELVVKKRRRLLPLVEHRLRVEGAPSDLEGRSLLREYYEWSRDAHVRNIECASLLLCRFERAGIDAILLKGLPFSLAWYPDPVARSMVDIDLLVRTTDLEAAWDIAVDNGWVARRTLAQNPVRRRREMGFRDGTGRVLDLHWHVHPAFVGPGDNRATDDAFFARATPQLVGDAAALALDPTDAFAHVLVHGAQRGWRTHPLWVADAAMLIDHGPELDADRLISLAREFNVALAIARGLAYLDARFDRRPRFIGGAAPFSDLARLARRPQLRQRRIYAQVVAWGDESTWSRRALGPFAITYDAWCVQTMTWSRRAAMHEFPGWLADAWRLPSATALPRAAWERARRRRAS